MKTLILALALSMLTLSACGGSYKSTETLAQVISDEGYPGNYTMTDGTPVVIDQNGLISSASFSIQIVSLPALNEADLEGGQGTGSPFTNGVINIVRSDGTLTIGQTVLTKVP